MLPDTPIDTSGITACASARDNWSFLDTNLDVETPDSVMSHSMSGDAVLDASLDSVVLTDVTANNTDGYAVYSPICNCADPVVRSTGKLDSLSIQTDALRPQAMHVGTSKDKRIDTSDATNPRARTRPSLAVVVLLVLDHETFDTKQSGIFKSPRVKYFMTTTPQQ